MSVPPPGAKPTMTRIGLVGYVDCAADAGAHTSAGSSAASVRHGTASSLALLAMTECV
jgi:hypothetical protein